MFVFIWCGDEILEKRKLIKKLEKNLGIKKLKNQINAISGMFAFLVIAGLYAIYLNHSGVWLSYGILIFAVSMVILALFMSYRIKLQVRLNEIKKDYRECVVTPYAREFFEEGDFSKKGGPTEREIIATNMFSDTKEYKYTSCNELKGVHKGVRFSNCDVFEDCEINDAHVRGRFFVFDIDTKNINPVVFTSSSAPIIDCQNHNVHLINPKNEVISRMFRVYAFDEKEANTLLTTNMVDKLRQLVGLQLGKIVRICFAHGKIYMYFTTESNTYEEVFTKKHVVEKELDKIRDKFTVVGKIIDIL